MASTSPLSQQQHPDSQRADDMDTTTAGLGDEEQKPESMQVVVEALPDIESGDAHTLGAAIAGVNGKETDVVVDDESDDADDGTSGNESDGDSERGIKRVKLDKEGEETLTATQEQGEAGSSNPLDTEGTAEGKAAEEEDETFELRMTWAGQGFDLRVQGSDRLYDFKVCSTGRTRAKYES
jgi:hypothetical protein